MGWLWTHNDLPVKEYLVKSFNWEREDGSYGKTLDIAIKNLRTAYIAYEIYRPGEEVKVVALVILLGYAPKSYHNFGYKDMDETMGPCESECPERILKLLTPTEDEWANAWRERCWENIRKAKEVKKLKNGMRIKTKQPLTFSNGDVVQEFIIVDIQKKIFCDAQNQYLKYKIRPRTLRDIEIIPA